ncbi:PH domain-containing protein [Acetobacterium wieringae]|uniref:PH domain-containing protein n=1 Tax=Acetobacterium wieringae TaxID=52694 RepID=UPI0026EBEA41|nr:PH domain-containing protein [Acetobacterium wieringae]
MTYFVSLLHTINPLFFALLAVLALLLWKAIYTFKTYPDDPELRRNAIKEMSVGGLVLVLILGIFIVVPLIAGVTVNDDELSLRLPTGFTFETYPEADILSAKIVSLDQTEYAIVSKVVGTEIRSYREGIFQLQNGTEAAVFANGNTAILVETPNRILLLGPDRFDDFVKSFSEKLIPVQP